MGEHNFLMNRLTGLRNEQDWIEWCEAWFEDPEADKPMNYPCWVLRIWTDHRYEETAPFFLYPGDTVGYFDSEEANDE